MKQSLPIAIALFLGLLAIAAAVWASAPTYQLQASDNPALAHRLNVKTGEVVVCIMTENRAHAQALECEA